MTTYQSSWQKMVESLNQASVKEEVTPQPELITEDQEAYMLLTELKSIADKAQQCVELVREDMKDFDDVEYDAWLQSKVTKCNDYMNTVFDYMMYSEDEDD